MHTDSENGHTLKETIRNTFMCSVIKWKSGNLEILLMTETYADMQPWAPPENVVGGTLKETYRNTFLSSEIEWRSETFGIFADD